MRLQLGEHGHSGLCHTPHRRGILRCRFCSALQSMMRWRTCRVVRGQGSTFSPFWTILLPAIAVYNLLAEQLWAVAGIRLHTGKTHVWNRAAERPPDMDDPEGIKILGTPVGFVQGAIHTRLEDEAKLWDAISWVQDLQSLAVPPPVRRSSLSPPPANSAPFSVWTLRG